MLEKEAVFQDMTELETTPQTDFWGTLERPERFHQNGVPALPDILNKSKFESCIYFQTNFLLMYLKKQ